MLIHKLFDKTADIRIKYKDFVRFLSQVVTQIFNCWVFCVSFLLFFNGRAAIYKKRQHPIYSIMQKPQKEVA